LGIDVGIAALGWAEAPIQIARMTLTVKLDGNWSSVRRILLQTCASTP
jgi:hypothetical protein